MLSDAVGAILLPGGDFYNSSFSLNIVRISETCHHIVTILKKKERDFNAF